MLFFINHLIIPFILSTKRRDGRENDYETILTSQLAHQQNERQDAHRKTGKGNYELNERPDLFLANSSRAIESSIISEKFDDSIEDCPQGNIKLGYDNLEHEENKLGHFDDPLESFGPKKDWQAKRIRNYTNREEGGTLLTQGVPSMLMSPNNEKSGIEEAINKDSEGGPKNNQFHMIMKK